MSVNAPPQTNKHKYENIHLTFGLLPEDVIREIQTYLPPELERFYNPQVAKEWLKYRNRVLNEINCVGGKGFITLKYRYKNTKWSMPVVIIKPIGHIVGVDDYDLWIMLLAISVISSNCFGRKESPARYKFDISGLHPSKRHYFYNDTTSERHGSISSRPDKWISKTIEDVVYERHKRALVPSTLKFDYASHEQKMKFWKRRHTSPYV